MNSKIVINVKDIRMILRKIYFYRKSAVEIFTKNKSYFFNFSHKTSSENYCTEFTNLFAFFITEFFPIGIRTEKKVEMIYSYMTKKTTILETKFTNSNIMLMLGRFDDNDPKIFT